ncbi:hypothetical protein E2K98_12875 [Bacillus salipaludis]|uniref:Uncharacterized protein n=1 Tax=Bacillus salipaludis TaxID=2547811 RepID=A0A4R5VT48_9BACI|nr:hypothetical protein [Bacillus salipaludis]TDK61777.1 hypothetical protein E2K98_12875 [Bacillus salipaludis]
MDIIESSYIDLAETPSAFQKEVKETLLEWDYKLLCVRRIKSNPYGNITQYQYTAFMHCRTFEWLELCELIVNDDVGETEIVSKKMYIDDIKEFLKFCPELFK